MSSYSSWSQLSCVSSIRYFTHGKKIDSTALNAMNVSDLNEAIEEATDRREWPLVYELRDKLNQLEKELRPQEQPNEDQYVQSAIRSNPCSLSPAILQVIRSANAQSDRHFVIRRNPSYHGLINGRM